MAFSRTLADPTRDGTLFVYDLTTAPTAVDVPRGVTVRVVDEDDVELLDAAMLASGHYPARLAWTRIAAGRRPYIVLVDGLAVAYGWVAFTDETIGDLGIAFRLGEGEVYIYDCATRADYRGRGYYPLLLRWIVSDLRRLGQTRAWIGTAPGNAVSQRGILRAGFTKVADVHIASSEPWEATLYGVPGIAGTLLERGAWSFSAVAQPDAGTL